MDVKLPHLGEGADSGTVVNLFVNEGDEVAEEQPLLELENEKAGATIPSTASGKVTKIFVKTGDKVSVGQRLLSLSEADAGKPAKGAEPKAEKKGPETGREEEAAQKEEPEEAEEGDADTPKGGHQAAASPSIRKLAVDLGIDLARVRGSERGGRIVLADLRAYIQRLQSRAGGAAPKATTPAAAEKPKAEPIDFSKWGPISKKPLSSLRQVIARRMAENWNTVPHVTQFDEADVS